MDRPEEELTGPPAEQTEAGGPPPEFLNPESPRYQPWAEKQITNAVKEKRPLQEFMAEFDARVATYGDIGSGTWDPSHQERLLAKFSNAQRSGSAPRRRRRRRPGGSPAGPPVTSKAPNRRPPGAPPQPSTESGSAGERRRRRRRRPRGGRRPPEAGSPG